MDYLTTQTSLSPIQGGFAPSFVNYKKGCTRLAAASDKVYQLLANGRWFSPGTPASSTTKTGRHDIAEILLKKALNTKKIYKIKSNGQSFILEQCFNTEKPLTQMTLHEWTTTQPTKWIQTLVTDPAQLNNVKTRFLKER